MSAQSKKPKSKMEETQAFLDELAADFPEPTSAAAAQTPPTSATTPALGRVKAGGKKKLTGGKEKVKDVTEDAARVSLTIERSATPDVNPPVRVSTDSATPATGTDPEADLAFLEAQLAAAPRRPASALAGSRPGTPASAASGTGKATIGAVLQAPTGVRKSSEQSRTGTPVNEASAPTSAGAGWGSSWWNSASTMLNTAKSVAIEQVAHVARQADEVQSTARKVAVEGARDVVNLEAIAARGRGLQQLREQLGDRVKGVDLEKLRHELVTRGQSALSEIINTVAPPIGEHEVVQVWFSHDMKGYDGVEGVVLSAIESIMQQTSSIELFYSSPHPPRSSTESRRSSGDMERSINPVEGWERAWEKTGEMLQGVKERMKDDPRRGHQNPDLPVLTIPVYLHLQPVLVPLPFPEPTTANTPPNHLTFLITLHDDVHSLQCSTVTQYSPGDWLDVPYEVSDWVEDRLVEVLRNGVQGVVQEYVATRMNLKGRGTPVESSTEDRKAVAAAEDPVVAKEAGVGAEA